MKQGEVVSFAEAQRRDRAERLAIATLEWLGREPDRLATFIDQSGIKPEFIRAAASNPWFLWGVLAFMSRNERLIEEATADLSVAPAAFSEGLAVLDSRYPKEEQPPRTNLRVPLQPRALYR